MTARRMSRGAFNAAQTGQSMNDAQRIATEAIIFPELRPAIERREGQLWHGHAQSYGPISAPTLPSRRGLKRQSALVVANLNCPPGPLPHAGTASSLAPAVR